MRRKIVDHKRSVLALVLLFASIMAAGPLIQRACSARDEKQFPTELTAFHRQGKVVFDGEGPGHWDVKIRERGWILREDGQYKMWFTGYDGTKEGTRLLGYATSPDGLSWTRYGDKPLYAEGWVEDMMIVKENGRYVMFAEGFNDQAQLLTSPDGLQWKRQGQLDVRYASGEPLTSGPYGTPTGWYENGTWYLFYERGDRGVWLATSKDLKVFTNVQDEPVLAPGPGEYDHDQIALNQIVKLGNRYYAYYHGAKSGPKPLTWTTGLATSSDLVHWTKYAGNPLVTDESSGIVVHDGREFRLYTMHGQVRVHFPSSAPADR
jgi:sucrose-6-phosphate hydrolase SacC (GH32 family)